MIVGPWSWGSDETNILTDGLGDYGFFDLPDGNYNVAVIPPVDWSSTATAAYNVDVDSSGADVGLDFGIAQNDHAYLLTYEDTNGDGVFDSDELVMPDTPMYIDIDGDGLFTPEISEFYFNDTDVDFSDNTLVTSTIDVPATADPITGLSVEIDATHTWVADLDIALLGPTA